MENKTEYILRKVSDNPFDKSFPNCYALYEKGKEQDVLNDQIAIAYSLPKWLNDEIIIDKVFTKDDFKFEIGSKKSKHLTIGDPIEFDHIYMGTLVEIVDNDKDFWDDMMVIKNCKLIPNPFGIKSKHPEPEETTMTLRRHTTAIDWKTVEFKCPCCSRY